MRNANNIVHQKIALMQVRQAVLLCYLQILRQFLISYASTGRNSGECRMRRTCAYDANNQPLGITGMNRIKFTKEEILGTVLFNLKLDTGLRRYDKV